MVAVQRGLLLAPELHSVFDFAIIDPPSLLVELDKFSAVGDSLYLFAISLLLYRVIRTESSSIGSRAKQRIRTNANATEGTPQSEPPSSRFKFSSRLPQITPLGLIFFNHSDSFKPELPLTSVAVDFSTIDSNPIFQSDLDGNRECGTDHRALLVDVEPVTEIDNDWMNNDGLTGDGDTDGDDDLDINYPRTGVSLTTVVLHLIILLARTLDSSRSIRHLTLFRRQFVAYEYLITISTLLVLLVRCRRRITRLRFTHALASSFTYYLFPAFWFAICATHHPWLLYPSHHLQFVAWTVTSHPGSPDSDPWQWGSEEMVCESTLPYCRAMWTFAHALAAVAEVPQLIKLYRAGCKQRRQLLLTGEEEVTSMGTGRDEGVMAYVSLVALSKFFYLPIYIAMFTLTKMYDPILYLSQLVHVTIFGVFAIVIVRQNFRADQTSRESHSSMERDFNLGKEEETYGRVLSSAHADRSPLRERLHS